MNQKKELGKGLQALISNINREESANKSTKMRPEAESYVIDIDKIKPNPHQPRRNFEDEALTELATSIKTFGVIQPLTVRKTNQDEYQIISGERRYRACLMADLKQVPAYVRSANDQEVLEMALVENIQREDLNPIEIAITYSRLMEECALTQEKLSERVGKQRSTISNYIRILKLSPEIQTAVKNRTLSMGHARVIAGINDLLYQNYLFKEIIAKDLSVREAEKMAQLHQGSRQVTGKNEKEISSGIHPMIKPIEDRISAFLGTKVQINRKSDGSGQILIHFNSDQSLNDILDKFEDES
jgi:ParB family chromosome partitioning protein